MAEISELIKDLEAATEGSRELSDRVLLALGWQNPMEDVGLDDHDEMIQSEYWYPPDMSGGAYSPNTQPDPTRSVDAALALVPEDCPWTLKGNKENGGFAELHIPGLLTIEVASTPALALTIACLKAKEATS